VKIILVPVFLISSIPGEDYSGSNLLISSIPGEDYSGSSLLISSIPGENYSARIIFTRYARSQKDWNQNHLHQVCSKSKRLEPE
jgi:hypothetical protein